MNYSIIKYIIIAILVISNILLFSKFKGKIIFKYLFLFISILLGTCLIFSKYQYYATDNINRQYFPVSDYKYNEDETKVKVEYYNDKNEKVSIDLKSEEVQINMSNGLGEIEKRQREYKKEILFFNTFKIPLGSNFQKDTDLVVLNQTNFMSEEELQEYIEYMEQINNPINQNEEVIKKETQENVQKRNNEE